MTAAPQAAPASYSTVTIARRLGVSIQTVQRWVDAGHLKAWVTLGGHRRIDAASAEELIAKMQRGERARAVAPRPASQPLPDALTLANALDEHLADGTQSDFDVERAAATLRHQHEAIQELAYLLKELNAIVLGECPSLLDEDSGGDSRLALAIESALAKVEAAGLKGSQA